MKLIEFPEVTHRIAENQDQYITMPAHIVADEPEVRVICCWQLSFKERFKLLFTGKIWHSIMTFGSSLQPQLLTLDDPFESYYKNQEETSSD